MKARFMIGRKLGVTLGPGFVVEGAPIVRRCVMACCAMLICIGALASPGRAASVDGAYSPKDIFAPQNNAVIYPDCTQAHDAANFLAEHADTASPDEAVGAQQFFLTCIHELRGVYSTNATRYLLLALAAATYIEAKGTTGARHADALKRGIDALGYVLPRPVSNALRTNPAPRVPDPQTASNAAPVAGNPRASSELPLNGARSAWQFAPLADSLRKAYEGILSADAPAASH
jgi:hypothetical protein